MNAPRQALLALRMPDAAGWRGWVRHEGVQQACERLALWLAREERLWLASDEPAGKTLLLRLLAREDARIGHVEITDATDAGSLAKALAKYSRWALDLPADAGERAQWTAFHLLEQTGGRAIVLAARRATIASAPPELRSRAGAMDFVEMRPPMNDEALRAVLRAELQRRQWELSERLLDLLLLHAPRRLEDQIRWIDWLDRQALAERRRVTWRWMRRMLREKPIG